MLPEGQKLHNLFKNLSKLFIHGIYAKFGLSWTITLLEAAPLIKIFGIKVISYLSLLYLMHLTHLLLCTTCSFAYLVGVVFSVKQR
jgi:hypothetical protein